VADASTAPERPLLRALIVEDSEFDALILVNHLRQGGWRVESKRVASAETFERELQTDRWDLVLCDHFMPGFSAPEALVLYKQSGKDMPFIIVSGGIEEGVAIEAMKSGAHDFMTKGSPGRLVPAIQRELREAAVRAARRQAETALRESELRYRSVWENSTDAVLLIDLDGVIRFGNPAVKTIFGWETGEVCGKTLDFLQTTGTPTGTWKTAAGAEDRRVFETSARRADGSEVEVEIGFTRMRMGQQEWLVAFIRDITERRRHEAEIRKTRQEFAAAREIQSRLFPKAPPQVPGFDIAGVSHAAEATGGDSFDYLPLPDGAWAVLVADVAGHGMGPALLMAETRFCLRMTARSVSGPAEILTQANRLLAEDLGGDRYVTVSLASIHPESRVLRHASAGHPATWVLDETGKIKASLRRTGKPLGRQGNAAYTENPTISLESGDVVLQLTDGIDEAMRADGSLFTVERVLDLIRANGGMTSAALAELICAETRAFTHPEPQTDDFTVVIVRVL
jgi:PAS domain S-box-containing protein